MSGSSADRNPLDRLAEEFVARFRAGQRPSLTEYAVAHPQMAEEIRELFPALVDMEQLKPATADHIGSLKPIVEPADPIRVGEFRILRRVGSGGMGVVYEAVQESLGRHVALKLLPAEALVDPQRLERFRREARAAARLHHTNIVPVFGVGEADGRYFYAMQFISGHPLDAVVDEVRRLKEKPIPAVSMAPRAISAAAAALLTGTFAGKVSAEGVGELPKADGENSSSPVAESASQSVASSERSSSNPALSGSISEGGKHYWYTVARIGAQVADALAYAHAGGHATLYGHTGHVRCVAFTPDGRYIVTAGEEGMVWVWEAATGRPIKNWQATAPKNLTAAALSPDGKQIAVAQAVQVPHEIESGGKTWVGQVKIWDVPAGTEKKEPLITLSPNAPDPKRKGYRFSRNSFWELAFSSDQRLLFGQSPEAVWVWDAATGREVKKFATAGHALVGGMALGPRTAGLASLEAPQNSPTSNYLLGFRDWGGVRTGPSPIQSRYLGGANHNTRRNGQLAIHPWGRWIAYRSPHNELLLNPEDLRTIGTLTNTDQYVSTVLAVSPDGGRLAVGNWSGTIRIWDVSGQQPIEKLELVGHRSTVTALAFSPDGQRLVSGAYAEAPRNAEQFSCVGEVKVWDLRHGRDCVQMDFSSNRTFGETRSPALAFLDSNRLLSMHTGSATPVIVTSSNAKIVQAWDVRNGKPLPSPLEGKEFPSGARMAFDICGNRIAIVSNKTLVLLEDGRTQKIELDHFVDSVTFSPDGSAIILSANYWRALFDWTTKKLLATQTISSNMDNSFLRPIFTRNGKQIISCSTAGNTAIRDAGDLRVIRELQTGAIIPKGYSPNPAQNPKAIAVNPDETLVAISTDESIKLWDLKTGQLLCCYLGHTSLVSGLKFSPDGRFLISGGADRTLRIWDASPREILEAERFKKENGGNPTATVLPLITLEEEGSVGIPAFSPDGRRIAYLAGTNLVIRESPASMPVEFGHEVLIPDGKTPAASGRFGYCDLSSGLRKAVALDPTPEAAERRESFAAFDPEWHARMVREAEIHQDLARIRFHLDQLVAHGYRELDYAWARAVIPNGKPAADDPWTLLAACRFRLAADPRGTLRLDALDEWKILWPKIKETRNPELFALAAELAVLAPSKDARSALELFLSDVEKWDAAAPGRPATLRLHGGLLLRSGRLEEAIRTFEAAVAARGESGLPREELWLAAALAHSGRLVEARKHLAKADRQFQAGWADKADPSTMNSKVQTRNYKPEKAMGQDPASLFHTAPWDVRMEMMILAREAKRMTGNAETKKK